jgi:hypothetical protein
MAPTLNITIQDVFNRLGGIDDKIEVVFKEQAETSSALKVLTAVLEERCKQHRKDIDAVAGAGRENAAEIVDINKRLDATRDYAKGGFGVGKIAIGIIIWILTTFGAAVTAGYITVQNVHAQPQAPAASTTTTP